MKELVTIVDKNFIDIIKDDVFVIGLDYTGLYAFTDNDSKSEISQEFYDLKKDLRLDDSIIVLCHVGTNAGYDNDVPLDKLEDWIMSKTAERPRCLTREILQSIEDCYNDNEKEDQAIVDVLKEFRLSDMEIVEILDSQPKTLKELTMIGIDDEIAPQILDILLSGKYTRNPDTEERVRAGVAVDVDSFIWKKCLASLLCAAVSSVVLIMLKIYPVSIIINIMGIWCVYKTFSIKETASTKIAMWANLILAAYGLFLFTIPSIIGSLKDFNW